MSQTTPSNQSEAAEEDAQAAKADAQAAEEDAQAAEDEAVTDAGNADRGLTAGEAGTEASTAEVASSGEGSSCI